MSKEELPSQSVECDARCTPRCRTYLARFLRVKRSQARPRFWWFLATTLAIGTSYAAAQKNSTEVTAQVQSLYQEAMAAAHRGDTQVAIQKYLQVLRIAPHLANAYNNLGMLYYNEQDYAHGLDVLKHGLELKPQMPSAAAMLGMTYYKLGEQENAEKYLKMALRSVPSDQQVEVALATVLLDEGKLEEAADHLRTLTSRLPKNQEAWYLLGKTYLQLSQRALKETNEIAPDSVIAHQMAGEVAQSMQNYDSALVEYSKSLSLAPNAPGSHLHLGTVYWLQGQWQDAEQEFRKELDNDPHSCQAQWKLGNTILEKNDPANDAMKYLSEAVEHCPLLMQARVDRARASLQLGNPDEALSELQIAVKDSPQEPSIHFLLAKAYHAKGMEAEMRREMATYAELERAARAGVAARAKEIDGLNNEKK